MQMSHDEYLEIQEQLEDHFDGRYVKIEDCKITTAEKEEKIDRLTLEFAKSNTKLNILIAILSPIAVAALGIFVDLLIGG